RAARGHPAVSAGNRIDRRFAALRDRGRTALVPFMTAGDPSLDATVPVMHALVAAGADLLELGVPFSDPMADGPVIQQSSERALARGVPLATVRGRLPACLPAAAAARVLVLGSPTRARVSGPERATPPGAGAGRAGVPLVDCPPAEARDRCAALASA